MDLNHPGSEESRIPPPDLTPIKEPEP